VTENQIPTTTAELISTYIKPLTIRVVFDYQKGTEHPDSYQISGTYATEAERDAVLAQYPKSLKLRAGTCSYAGGIELPIIMGQGDLRPRKGNTINETALRRLHTLLDLAEFTTGNILNAYTTADAARAATAI
jgi:hypothetical protein